MHVFLLATAYGSAFDLTSYDQQAYAVTHGLNVYDYTARYPYPPVWIWIVDAVARLAPLVGIPFHVAIKLPASLADVAVAALLFEYVRARRGWVLFALLPAALYALNPIPALISAAHGQFDGLPVFFTLLAFHLRDRDRRWSLALSALSLGVAIALKAYPALLVPFLALTAPPGRKVTTLGLTAAPLAVATGIYVLAAGYSPAMVTHVLGYLSTTSMGWRLLTQGAGIPAALIIAAWITSDLLVMVFATLVPWLLFGRRAVLGVAATFALFLTIAPQASVQYLLWGLPFFCLMTTFGTVIYSAVGTLMLVVFYATSEPLALPWSLSSATVDALQRGYTYAVALVIAASAMMLVIALFKNQLANRASTFTSMTTSPTVV
jgi:hypothetical protein